MRSTATLPRPCRDRPADASPVAGDRAADLDLDALAAGIAADGIDRHERGVAQVVAVARAAGLRPALVAAVADPTHASVVRTRAFGRIALLLAQR